MSTKHVAEGWIFIADCKLWISVKKSLMCDENVRKC